MMTFLPYPSFTGSALCLDRQRLGKQRVEVLQMLRAIHGETKGYNNHPCTNMWRPYPQALVYYGIVICDEWIARGYKDTCKDKISKYLTTLEDFQIPLWFGDERLHSSHRSALLAKNPEHYGQFGWTDKPMDLSAKPLPYYWAS